MTFSGNIHRRIVILLLCMIFMGNAFGFSVEVRNNSYDFNPSELIYSESADEVSAGLHSMNQALRSYLVKSDYVKAKELCQKITEYIHANKAIDSLVLSDAYYYCGTFNLTTNNSIEAIELLGLSYRIRELKNTFDIIYANSLSNTGFAYYVQGDNLNATEFYKKALEIEKHIFGDSNPNLIQVYLSLSSSYLEINNYEDAIRTSDAGILLVNQLGGSDYLKDHISLLHNLGIAYIRKEDYRKAQVYIENAFNLSEFNRLEKNAVYINLLNSLAISFNGLGMIEKSIDYYELGLKAIGSETSNMTLNFINSYSIMLANAGFVERGKTLLANSMNKANVKFGASSREYNSMVKNYASYMNDFCKDPVTAIKYFEECKKYIAGHNWDTKLRDEIMTGYSLALAENENFEQALQVIQEVLHADHILEDNSSLFENPTIDELNADRRTLNIIKAKYQILSQMYLDTEDIAVLKSAANTSELMIAIIERVRINISEEESRLILGDNYRKMYLSAISDYEKLYSQTGENSFLDKAFEYSERSKAAGLIASTRELKATQFNVPQHVADLERDLQRRIGSYREMINNENATPEPDRNKIITWNENVLDATRRRDSLVTVFEQSYPEYYKIKYNTSVISLNEISKVTGRKDNYLSYVISDTVMYTFIINSKYRKLISTTIDSTFYNDINEFRKLLSNPSESAGARDRFESFKNTGYDLYLKILEPVKEFLTDGRIIVSPDNVLSYLPFETLLTEHDDSNDMIYRDLPYVLFKYDITYTYSATLLAEATKKSRSLKNSIIAFAPDYNKSLNIDSLITSRQASQGVLRDLPYAREEARYVAGSAGNTLLLNEDANESAFKVQAGSFDIIHMAMHTLLYDTDPMYSKMLFSLTQSSNEDNLLNTYEIYNIPLSAKMVVLSSCNTGIGLIRSGEGVMSLARGFLYSGSESVVMSMWEVEDKSGTSLVKLFYDNLSAGDSKSGALRKARKSYLKDADQLRSHPYFWATLIVYGNNSPLYFPTWLIILISGVIISGSVYLAFYLRKR